MRVPYEFLLLITVLLVARPLAARSLADLSEEQRKQVNTWMVERAQSMIEASKLDEALEGSWRDTKYSNPEIDALRKQYQELQAQLTKTQHLLRKKVNELPEMRARQQRLDELKGRVTELTAKVEEHVSLPNNCSGVL